MTIDCEKYQGRRRNICKGVESDGTPLRMSPAKRKAYIERWEGTVGKTSQDREHVASEWLSWLRLLSRPGDRGVGDVVERLAAIFGGRMFKVVAKAVGIDCGCGNRQDQLNRRFPFD